MQDKFQPRSSSFTWQSKQELYDHFQKSYDIDQAQVDQEIERAMDVFKLRKHRPINPRELWEKVGRTLEEKVGEDKDGDNFS